MCSFFKQKCVVLELVVGQIYEEVTVLWGLYSRCCNASNRTYFWA